MTEGARRWHGGLLAAAGLLGAAGVALGAASAHLGGGDLARLAATFLLIHAAAIPGLLAVPMTSPMAGRIASTLLGLGVTFFSGDIAVLAFTGRTPIPGLAPVGGLMLVAGWLVVMIGGVVSFVRGPSRTP